MFCILFVGVGRLDYISFLFNYRISGENDILVSVDGFREWCVRFRDVKSMRVRKCDL